VYNRAREAGHVDRSTERDIEGGALRSAALLLTPSVPVFPPSTRVDDALRELRGTRFESVSELAVCEDGRLVGLARLTDAFAAPEGATLANIMDSDPPRVGPGLHQERAAWKAVSHGEVSLAVVDDEERFLGMIPGVRLNRVLLVEHAEDLARLSGYMHDAASARSASAEPVLRRFVHRLPWLIIGLAGAFFSADIVGAFEARLEEKLLLVFFVPGIVYLADAVGTQTETLVIRGLSLGVPVRMVAMRELATGVVIGLGLGLVTYPLVLLRWGDASVALTVALALVLACAIANSIALLLPALFHRAGIDPAFGSGPLATVVQDLLSLVIYLSLALLLT
jgi:magnesium transporter